MKTDNNRVSSLPDFSSNTNIKHRLLLRFEIPLNVDGKHLMSFKFSNSSCVLRLQFLRERNVVWKEETS